MTAAGEAYDGRAVLGSGQPYTPPPGRPCHQCQRATEGRTLVGRPTCEACFDDLVGRCRRNLAVDDLVDSFRATADAFGYPDLPGVAKTAITAVVAEEAARLDALGVDWPTIARRLGITADDVAILTAREATA